jgi:hypothetical protein
MEKLPSEVFIYHVLPAMNPGARKRCLESLSLVSTDMRRMTMMSELHTKLHLRSGKIDEMMEKLDRVEAHGWQGVQELIVGCFSLSEADFKSMMERCARVLGRNNIKRIVLKMPQFAVDLGALGGLFRGLEDVELTGVFAGPFVGSGSSFSVRKLAITIWPGHNNRGKVVIDVTGMRCSHLSVKGNFAIVGKGDFEGLDLVWCDFGMGGRGALNWVQGDEFRREIFARVLNVGMVSTGRRMLPRPGYNGLTARVYGIDADCVKVLPEYIRIVTGVTLL